MRFAVLGAALLCLTASPLRHEAVPCVEVVKIETQASQHVFARNRCGTSEEQLSRAALQVSLGVLATVVGSVPLAIR